MNKWIKFGTLAVLALAIGLVGVSAASAQDDNPPAWPPAGAFGPHHGMGPGPGAGLLADYNDIIHGAIADALGISVDQFEAAIDEGETLYSLSETYGVDFEELRQAMDEARAEALEQAIDDGVVTPEQAEWMGQMPRGRGLMNGDCDGEGPLRDGTGEYGPRGGRRGGGF